MSLGTWGDHGRGAAIMPPYRHPADLVDIRIARGASGMDGTIASSGCWTTATPPRRLMALRPAEPSDSEPKVTSQGTELGGGRSPPGRDRPQERSGQLAAQH